LKEQQEDVYGVKKLQKAADITTIIPHLQNVNKYSEERQVDNEDKEY